MVERIKKWRKTGKQNGQTSCEITITQLIVFCGGAWRHALHQATAETLVRGTGGVAVALLSGSGWQEGKVTDLGSSVPQREEELPCKKP